MSSIAIITDTDASLPADLAARYGIQQVPIMIQFGQDTLRTEIDIDDVGLFARVDREGKLPTTSAPSPGQFLEAYEAAFAAGADAIVCLCVSSAISATYGAAVTAQEMLPERTIEVVDTRVVSMAQGFMALAAAEAALSTLKYLAMSGRVGHVAAGFGNLLSVKPILTMLDGKLDLLEKVRTRSKVLARVVELAGEAMAGQTIRQMAVLNVAARDEATAFEAQLRAALPCPETIIHANLTAGLSVHTGAGMLGVVVVS
jgi:fatty acid-binding protein DegV